MFTGLIEQLGIVISNTALDEETSRLAVQVTEAPVNVGESVAVDGVCLTCLPISRSGELWFDLSPETRRLTTLRALKAGDCVHIEHAMRLEDRLGGYLVSGHVDAVTTIVNKTWRGVCLELTIGPWSAQEKQWIFPKGNITLAGVNLTVNTISNEGCQVMLIPHTLEKTWLGKAEIGRKINVEFDYLARIVAHQLSILGATHVR